MSYRVQFQVTGFQVEDCRYGKNQSSKDAFEKVLCSFTEWVNATEHVKDTSIENAQGVYVKDVAKQGNVFAIVLWKASGARNTTYALSKSAPPNGSSASISKKNFAPDFIPGDPLYFMAFPERQKIYTLRPPLAMRTGREDFEKAIRFFMLNHLGLRKSLHLERNIELFDYEPDAQSASLPPPIFKTKLVRNKTALSDLIQNCHSIRKLVQEVPLKGRDKTFRDKILEPLIAVFSERLAKTEFENIRKARYELDVELDERQVQEILDAQENVSDGQRVGFKYKKDDTMHWADTYIDRRNLPLTFEEDTGVFSAKSILDAALEAMV